MKKKTSVKRAIAGVGIGVCVIIAAMIGAVFLAASSGYAGIAVFVVSLIIAVCAVVAYS